MVVNFFEKRKIRMAEMRRGGATYLEIAKKFELTMERVRQIINKYSDELSEPELKVKRKRQPNPNIVERRKKVVVLCKAGKTYREIARELGVRAHVIAQDIRLYNKTNPNEKIAAKLGIGMLDANVAERRKKVVELRKLGFMYKDIAKKLNTSLAIVMQDVQVYEAQLLEKSLPRIHVPIDDAAKKEIVKLRQAGVPLEEIAEQYDVSSNYISCLLKKMNVSGRKI
jgi:DNA-binding NarL/FixJ family response regulator